MTAKQAPSPAPPLARQHLIARGQRAFDKGIGADLDGDAALGMILVLRDVLTASTRPNRAADAAGWVEDLLQRSIGPSLQGQEVGCGKGCSYCCHQNVACTAPEIFRVAQAIKAGARTAPPVDALQAWPHLASEAERRRGLNAGQLVRLLAPCGVLREHACGVYAARPIACRALFSRSRAACQQAWQHQVGEIPLLGAPLDVAECVRTLLLAAVQSLGLPDCAYELTQAVHLALTTPDAEHRWLAGEDVFAALPNFARQPEARAIQQAYLQRLRP